MGVHQYNFLFNESRFTVMHVRKWKFSKRDFVSKFAPREEHKASPLIDPSKPLLCHIWSRFFYFNFNEKLLTFKGVKLSMLEFEASYLLFESLFKNYASDITFYNT